MKKVLLLALGIMICAQMAYGQAGVVGIYADAAGTTCTLASEPPAGYYNLQTYVVHTLGGPTTGIGFKVVPGGGWTAAVALSSITNPYLAAGDPFTGVNVGYGSCINAMPIMSYTILWNSAGTGGVCAYLSVEDNPATTFAGVEVNDCTLPYALSLPAPDSKFFINGNELSCGACAVPVVKKSWGKIKSLYN